MSAPKLVRTTLSIPADMLKSIDKIASDGECKSRNEFVTRALESELARYERQAIDAALAQMAQDPEYQQTVRQMDAEFAGASWDALGAIED